MSMSRWTSWMIAPIAASALMLSGCIFMQSSSISDSAGKGNAVSAQASDLGYILLVPPGNVTQMAADQLVNQCASGKVTNVQTELTVRNFLSIVQDYQASANGICM
jgi:hypothetical protein